MIESLRGWYRTAADDLRYQGIGVLLWRVVVKLFSPLAELDLHILYAMDLTQPVESHPAMVECRVEQAGEATVDAILDMQMPLPAPDTGGGLDDSQELPQVQHAQTRAQAYDGYVRLLRAGECCFVARVNGEIVHSNWVQFHDSWPVEDRQVDLMPGEVYTTDGFTAEHLRGKRLHDAVLSHMLRFAQGRGSHRAYTITDLTKERSRRGLRRLGWSRRGIVLYITPRGLGRTWLLRLGGDVEPMFRLARGMIANR